MPKIATTTLNLSEYRMVDGFYMRNGFSLVQDKYCTETGEPIFVNKRANGKWGYCDNDGTDFYVEWVEEEEGSTTNEEDEMERNDFDAPECEKEDEVECYGCGDTPCVKPADPGDTRFCESCAKIDADIHLALEDSDDEDSEEEEEDSEFMCELIDCITCKRPTMRKDMYWREGGCVMTEFCEPCHKAKIPDDMMVVPRYMFENEKGEKVKWCLCVMKL